MQGIQEKKNRTAYRCLIIIIDANIRKQLTEYLNDACVPIFYQAHGVGTVRSDILNLLGLGDPQKSITICFTPRARIRMLLAELNQALKLHKKGTGIAVSIPVSGMQGWLFKLLTSVPDNTVIEESEKEGKHMSETITHSMIVVTVNQGYSDDVMNTARSIGATGGTIVKGLRQIPSETANHFGISVQEEQEILLIVVAREKSTEVMSAIAKAHGISTPAHGVVFSLPVDGIIGL